MRAIVVLAAGMLLASCASSQMQQLLPAQPIICMSGPDCDAKWGRAALWMTDNSSFKVQVRTETTLQTAGPVPSETTPAFTVTKVARGEGRFEITFNGGCGNPYRCVPSIAESRARFVQFVLGEAPAPEPELSSAGAPARGR
jgi:hypothetical protein